MIRIRIINPDLFKNESDEKSDVSVDSATWYSRCKEYNWELIMDEDIKNCTVGHVIDSIDLNNVFLNTKSSVQDFIDFLQKAKESFR